MRPAIVLGLILTFVGPARADDWPQWLGPQRDGVWREDGILDQFPKDGPKLLWRQPIGGGYAGPAVAAGRVFVTDRMLATGAKNPSNPFARGEIPGTERILCLDAKSGETVWRHEHDCPYRISYPAGPRCTPTVDGDRVYTLGAMGHLFCFNANDGKIIWQRDFLKEFDAALPVWGFAAHPLVDGNNLICLVGGSNDRLVVAFDKMTGKEVWTSLSCGGDFGYCPPMIYTLGHHRQLIIWSSEAISALDPVSGKKIWDVDFKVKAALTAPTPRKVGDDKLLVSSFYNGSRLLQIAPDGRSAKVVWQGRSNSEAPARTDGLHSIMVTPFVRGDTVFGVCSYGQLRALDATTGKRLWESMDATRGRKTDADTRASVGPTDKERWSNAFIVAKGERFFLFNEQGELIIAELTPAAYKEIDRAVVLEPTNMMAGRPVIWVHPAFANKSMFARNDKEIVAVDLAR